MKPCFPNLVSHMILFSRMFVATQEFPYKEQKYSIKGAKTDR